MRMASDHFRRDGSNHVAKLEQTRFLCHLRVEHHLQQQVSQFVFQIDKVAALNRIGHFVSLFKCVGDDRGEILFDIPRTSAYRIS